jgi:16S rRNA U1498 N3-methylase RsmE
LSREHVTRYNRKKAVELVAEEFSKLVKTRRCLVKLEMVDFAEKLEKVGKLIDWGCTQC